MMTSAPTQTTPQAIAITAGTLMFKELSRFPMSHRAEEKGKVECRSRADLPPGLGEVVPPYPGCACETLVWTEAEDELSSLGDLGYFFVYFSQEQIAK
jgi:hypothetical protein